MTLKQSSHRGGARVYGAMLAPVLGMLALGAVLIGSAFSDKWRSQEIAATVERSTEGSDLAHELQKERGLSAGHVGSQGAVFRQELSAQRRKTDAVLERVGAAAIAATGPDETARRVERARRIDAAFSALATIRQRVDALSIPVSELAGFYTGAIRDLISLADDPLVDGGFDDMARRTVLYRSVLMAKEFAGVERAAGAVGFGSGAFTSDTYAWFNGLKLKQDNLFDRIRGLGAPAELAKLDAALASPAATRLESLRAAAKASVRSGSVGPVTGPDWFAASTAYLGELRQLERALAASIRRDASAQAADAWSRAMLILGAIAAFVLAFAVFGARYVHAMVSSLRGLSDAIRRIEGAEDGIEIPAQTRGDAVGEIARSLASISSQGAEAARVKAAVSASSRPLILLGADDFSVYENPAFETLAAENATAFESLAPRRGAQRDGAALRQAVDASSGDGRVAS